MSAVCSRCSHVFAHATACPRCGAPIPIQVDPAPAHGPRWQQTAWGRILIGLILAQGLFYGLRNLATGVLLVASEGNSDEVWADMRNLLILQGIQLFGLLVGGLLAGGGQRNGLVLGAVIGAWNGVLGVLLRQNPAQDLTVISLYGQPVLHIFVGAIGGCLGSLIWRPIPAAVPQLLAPPRKPAPRRKKPLFGGKIHWVRIILGAALAVAGSLCAARLFEKMIDFSAGKLDTTSRLQDQLITWEIRAIALILGGLLAGAGAPNGFKQGLFVGFASSVVLIALQAPPTSRWLEAALLTAVTTFMLCAVGGWFGSTLFPPVVRVERGSAFT